MRGGRFRGPFDGQFDARPGGPRGPEHRGHHPGAGAFNGGPFGGGPGGFPGFGGWPFEGRGRGPGRGGGGGGGRRSRGDVRAAVLVLLAEGPSNGYRIIGEVARRSDGAWKPSPGSVYPTLQQLQDEGLVVADTADAKQFTLTDEGRAYVEAEYAGTPPPWESVDSGPQEFHQVRRQIGQIAAIFGQVAMSGRPGDLERASDVLEACRRGLVAILAEDPREAPGG